MIPLYTFPGLARKGNSEWPALTSEDHTPLLDDVVHFRERSFGLEEQQRVLEP